MPGKTLFFFHRFFHIRIVVQNQLSSKYGFGLRPYNALGKVVLKSKTGVDVSIPGDEPGSKYGFGAKLEPCAFGKIVMIGAWTLSGSPRRRPDF